MEFNLTFSSVGDIIAVSQIIMEFSRGLAQSSESAKQYKELRDELDSFARMLMQVRSYIPTNSIPSTPPSGFGL